MRIVVGVSGEVCTVDLRHDRQGGPPFFLSVTDRRPEEQGGVFPFTVVGQFVVVAQFKTDRPARTEVAGNAEIDLQFAFDRMEVVLPLRRVDQVDRPFPVADSLTEIIFSSISASLPE